MTIRLAHHPPLAVEPLFSFLGERAIPGVETFDGRTFRRAMFTKNGESAVIALTPHPTRPHVALDVATSVATNDEPAPAETVEAARRLLDLDADPVTIDDVLARDPALRSSVRATPGMRLPGAVDGFELAVRAVLGQQVSVRAARTLAGRIATAAGTPLPKQLLVDGITHAFPTADQLAAAPLDIIGLTRRRIDTLHRLAELAASGNLDLSAVADTQSTKEALLAIPGVGPWTVAYVSMRALRDVDAFPATDLGVRLGCQALGLPGSPGEIRERAERWRPWRGYAVMHLWQAL